MSVFDTIGAGIIAAFTLLGLIRGFVREIFSLLGNIMAAYAAFRYSGFLYNQMAPIFKGSFPLLGKLFAFVAIYAATVIAASVLGALVRSVIKMANLSLADRLLGGAFGFAKAMFVLTVAFVLITQLFPETRNDLKRSRLYPTIHRAEEIMLKLAPREFGEKFLNKKSQGEQNGRGNQKASSSRLLLPQRPG